MDVFPPPEIIIERVVDGDTVELSQPLHGVTMVRLDALDTPETRTASCRKERDRGFEAKGYAKALLEGRAVTVHTTGKKGRYGRLIARIEINGMDYSQHMIERGYGVRWDRVWSAIPKEKRWCKGR